MSAATDIAPPVVAAVLVAALCHATWNALVKRSSDTFLSGVFVSAGCGLIAAVLLPFLAQPDRASWPLILMSSATQVVYVGLLAGAYRTGDMSQTYPLMRGVAPMLVAVASGPIVGEPLSLARWLGVALISLGVVGMAFSRGSGAPRNRAALAFALCNAAVIATYTVVDGIGVRRSGHPVSYGFWTFALTAVPLLLWVGLSRRRQALSYAVENWPKVMMGGTGTLMSYSLALWAMSVAPVAVVAALRETAILFATAISAFVLKEHVGPGRLVATGIILAGVVVVHGL